MNGLRAALSKSVRVEAAQCGAPAVPAERRAVRERALARRTGATALVLFVLRLITLTALCVGAADAQTLPPRLLTTGARLLLSPAPSSKLTAICICIATEPERDPVADAAGEIVARSLFNSSFNRSRRDMAASLTRIGADIEVVRAPDHVRISCLFLPSRAQEAVYLLCEVLKNSEFDDLERARKTLVAQQATGRSGFAAGVEAVRRVLQSRPDFADLPFARITAANAAAYFKSRYVADRTVIAVCGAFNASAISKSFEDSLADFDRRARLPLRGEPLYAHATRLPTRTLPQSGSAAYAVVGEPAPAVNSGDYPAFLILQAILGEGHGSRIFRRIRDKLGIGYSVGAIGQAQLSDPLIAYLEWDDRPGAGAEKPLSSDAALRLLSEQMDGLADDPPTAAEIERARSIVMARYLWGRERVKDHAVMLAWGETVGGGADFAERLTAGLAAVSREDVLRVARACLSPRAQAAAIPASDSTR